MLQFVQGLQVLVLFDDLFVARQRLEVLKQNHVVIESQQELEVIQQPREKRGRQTELLIVVRFLALLEGLLKLLAPAFLLLHQKVQFPLAGRVEQVGSKLSVVRLLVLVVAINYLLKSLLYLSGIVLKLADRPVQQALEHPQVYARRHLLEFTALFTHVPVTVMGDMRIVYSDYIY